MSALPDDVRALVIAAREAWEVLDGEAIYGDWARSLDKALEPFSSRVPYEDGPVDAPPPAPTFHHWLGADADHQDKVVRFEWVGFPYATMWPRGWIDPTLEKLARRAYPDFGPHADTPAPAPRKRQPWPDAV